MIIQNFRDDNGNIPDQFIYCSFCNNYHSYLYELDSDTIICRSCAQKIIDILNIAQLKEVDNDFRITKKEI